MQKFLTIKRGTSVLGDQRGATAIEYALVASLLSVAAIAAFHNVGDKVFNNVNSVDQSL